MPEPSPPPPDEGVGSENPVVLNDRYRLLDVVGEGGMAVVWRAEDTMLDRTVAVKILRDQYASDPEFLERFRTEARNAAGLNHPGIVAVHDVGEDGGRHFLVMEYVPGRDLKAIIRDDAPLDPERAMDIGIGLARAVGAAHESGLIHRDIKPQNVLVAPDGRMKVADFGIARAASAVGNTAPGIVLGTVHYIAPEQARGDSATPASDVYSLGVVLYEMLTGRVPHDADSQLGVAMKVMSDPPPPIASLNARVPGELIEVVERAMALEAEDRFESAGELARALEALRARAAERTGPLEAPATAAEPRGGRGTVDPEDPTRDGPMLDWTGLGLGVVAVLALAGLIPLWIGAIQRIQRGGESAAAPMVAEAPEPTETVAPPTATPVRFVYVPDVTGLPESDALETLRADDLAVTVEIEEMPGTALGAVGYQRPEPGEAVPAGTVVKITVAGRGSTRVPPVQRDPAAMEQALLNAGLVPQKRYIWRGAASPTRNQVIGLSPVSDTGVPFDYPVTIDIDSGGYKQLGVTFAGGVFLAGVELITDTYAAGQGVRVVPLWQATESITRPFGVRIAAGDDAAFAGSGGAGTVLGRTEGAPSDRPASEWAQGENVTGLPMEVPIDSAAPPGTYSLWIELFPTESPETAIPVVDQALARRSGPRVRIAQIRIVDAP